MNPTPPAHLLSCYIVAKNIKAMPMTKAQFEQSYFVVKGSGEKAVPQADGFLILHDDGYCSWCDKSTFEKSARLIPNTEHTPPAAATIPGSVAQKAAADAAAATAKAKAEDDAAHAAAEKARAEAHAKAQAAQAAADAAKVTADAAAATAAAAQADAAAAAQADAAGAQASV